MGQDSGMDVPTTPGPAAAPPALRAAFEQVRARIRAAAERSGRAADSVQLLAVSKTFGPEVVAAAAALGQRRFGENYVQEALAKMDRLALGEALEWHFIGPLQSNKTRHVAERFDWVQSLDRASIAQRLAAQRPPELGPLQVLLEVNISGEASKSGIEPDALPELAAQVAGLPRLCLRGLMAIPRPGLAPDQSRATFERLRQLFEALRGRYPQADTLSMGMSADFEEAIAAGSTLVRVGSALFGERQ
jgi:pyridoxal phosphate enzyme (YggS family)